VAHLPITNLVALGTNFTPIIMPRGGDLGLARSSREPVYSDSTGQLRTPDVALALSYTIASLTAPMVCAFSTGWLGAAATLSACPEG